MTVNAPAIVRGWLCSAWVEQIEAERAAGGDEVTRRIAQLDALQASGLQAMVGRGPEPYPEPAPVPGPCPFPSSYPQHNTPTASLHATGAKRS